MKIEAKVLYQVLANWIKNNSILNGSYAMIKENLFLECKDHSAYINQSIWLFLLAEQKYIIISTDAVKAWIKFNILSW
jgi:hypothetical protein